MRRTRLVLAAMLAICASLLIASPARAAGVDVLTTGSAGGPNVAVGDVISGSLKPGTQARFATTAGGSTGVSCSVSSFSATVLTNPAAGGTATLSLTAVAFGMCASNLTGLTLRTITVNNLPYSVAINGSAGTITISGGSAGPIQLTFGFSSMLGSITCSYRAVNNVITGSLSGGSVSFTNQQLTKSAGANLCPANFFFSATYIVTDTTAGGALVFFQ
jgi:hypothetical protein